MATAPIVLNGRVLYTGIAQWLFDNLEANGWTKEMSILTDGVMKKNFNGADHFIFFTPITTDGYTVVVGNTEGYTRGKTGVNCVYTEVTSGTSSVAEVGSITVQNFCTTNGNFNFRFQDGTIDRNISIAVTTTDNTTALVATKIKNALDADTAFTASYTTAISGNIITFTKKINGAVNITFTFDIGISGVAGTFVNKGARTMYFGSTTVASASYVSTRLYIWDDHIVLGVNPDTGIANAFPFLLYFGAQKYYSGVETNNWGDVCGGACLDTANTNPVKNRTGASARPNYSCDGSVASTNPGRGGFMYIAPMTLGNATDGVSGDYQDIYGLPATGVNHLDTFTQGGIVYDIWISGTTGTSTFAKGTKVIAVYAKNV